MNEYLNALPDDVRAAVRHTHATCTACGHHWELEALEQAASILADAMIVDCPHCGNTVEVME